MDENNEIVVTDEVILRRIYTVRGYKVMIDRDLAVLYQVGTKVLNQAVRRNLRRFPDDFMFQLNQQELTNWKSQFVTSKIEKMGLRKRPLAFTEHGIAMLSSVLNSDLAIQMNIRIIRIFSRVRIMIDTHKEILHRLLDLEKNDADQEIKIMLILDYLKSVEEQKQQEESQKNRKRIGFRTREEEK